MSLETLFVTPLQTPCHTLLLGASRTRTRTRTRKDHSKTPLHAGFDA